MLIQSPKKLHALRLRRLPHQQKVHQRMSLKNLQDPTSLDFLDSPFTHVPSTQLSLGRCYRTQLLTQELHRLGSLTIVCHNSLKL